MKIIGTMEHPFMCVLRRISEGTEQQGRSQYGGPVCTTFLNAWSHPNLMHFLTLITMNLSKFTISKK